MLVPLTVCVQADLEPSEGLTQQAWVAHILHIPKKGLVWLLALELP